ncbi:MAG TPA: DUF6640 family protein [Bryobacteraceae bacterium]|jgi:hypothetical protein
MTRIRAGRALLTVLTVATTVLSFVLDWSPNHLLNPLWRPHARFHGALLLFHLAGVSGTSIWLLWRRSREPEIALRTTALLSLSFWTPLFYITSILPGSTSWAGAPEADPRLRGSLVTPNLIVAAVFVVCAGVGYIQFHARLAAELPQRIVTLAGRLRGAKPALRYGAGAGRFSAHASPRTRRARTRDPDDHRSSAVPAVGLRGARGKARR